MAQVQALEKGIEPERPAPPPGLLALGADPGQIAYDKSERRVELTAIVSEAVADAFENAKPSKRRAPASYRRL